LDGSYSQDAEFLKTQEQVFEEMLILAEKYSLPVSVHSRGASLKTIEFLSRYRLNGVLLHWFAGTESELAKANQKGYFVSFGPATVYSNRMQRLACKASTDLMLIETDGPVSYGACFEGRMAEPTFLASVWHSLSHLLGVKPAELEYQLEKNFAAYIKSKG
jgi:TatD DNase family protein